MLYSTKVKAIDYNSLFIELQTNFNCKIQNHSKIVPFPKSKKRPSQNQGEAHSVRIQSPSHLYSSSETAET